jgi:hypothetical protein
MTKQGFQGDRSNSQGPSGARVGRARTIDEMDSASAPGDMGSSGESDADRRRVSGGPRSQGQAVFARSLMSQAALTVGSNRRSKLFGELLKAAVLFAVDGDGGRGRPEGRRQDVAPRSNEEVKEVGEKTSRAPSLVVAAWATCI